MPVPATLEHGPGFTPERVHRGHLSWLVLEVLEHWKHPASAPETLRLAECTERWRLRVWGPVPWNPSLRGEFTMVAETFGDRPGWFIAPVLTRPG